MVETVAYETLQNGKIKQTKSYTRGDGVDVTEKVTFRLSEAEAQLASQLSSLEAQRDAVDAQITELKKKREELAALRA